MVIKNISLYEKGNNSFVQFIDVHVFTLLISSTNEYFNVLNDKKKLNSVNIKKCRNIKSLMFFENFEKYQIFCDKNRVTGGNKLTM